MIIYLVEYSYYEGEWNLYMAYKDKNLANNAISKYFSSSIKTRFRVVELNEELPVVQPIKKEKICL